MATLEIRLPTARRTRPTWLALWTGVFPDTRAWNQPQAYIRRKLAAQPELFLVGARGGRVVATVLVGYDGVRGWIYHLAVAARAPPSRLRPCDDGGGRGAPARARLPEDQPADRLARTPTSCASMSASATRSRIASAWAAGCSGTGLTSVPGGHARRGRSAVPHPGGAGGCAPRAARSGLPRRPCRYGGRRSGLRPARSRCGSDRRGARAAPARAARGSG